MAADECWLDTQAIRQVLEAYRNQNSRASGCRPKVQLTPKESLIVSCVTQGIKNKEIALRVGTTGVADRLELALHCLNHHIVDNAKVPALPSSPPAATPSNGAAHAAAAGATAGATAAATVPSVTRNSPENSTQVFSRISAFELREPQLHP